MACIRSNACFYAVAGGCTFKPGIYPWIVGQAATDWIQYLSILMDQNLSLRDLTREEVRRRQLWLFQGLLSRKMDRAEWWLLWCNGGLQYAISVKSDSEFACKPLTSLVWRLSQMRGTQGGQVSRGFAGFYPNLWFVENSAIISLGSCSKLSHENFYYCQI